MDEAGALPLDEAGDDPNDDPKSYMPWDQGVWEDEDGRLGARQGEDYVRDRDEVHEALNLRIVWDGLGGRSVEGSIRRNLGK